MGLSNLPNELLLLIATNLDQPTDLNRFIEIYPGLIGPLIPVLENAVQGTSESTCLAICWAAENGNESLIRLLIENHVDIEARDTDKTTALHFAASGMTKNNIPVVKLLLSNVHDPTSYINGGVFDDYGYTMFHCAAENGCDEMINFLLAVGADVNQANRRNGRTALHVAAQLPSTSTIEILLNNGANLEARDHNGQTPLLYGLRFSRNSMVMVQALLRRGVNTYVQDNHGQGVLHVLFELQETGSVHQIAKLLLKAGVEINAQDSYGSTALHVAVREFHEQRIINLLLKWGANLSIWDRYGETAIVSALGRV